MAMRLSIIVVIHEILNFFFVPFAVSTVLRLKGKKEKVINNQQKNTIKLQNVKKKLIKRSKKQKKKKLIGKDVYISKLQHRWAK